MVRACKGLDLVLFADDTNIFAEGSDPAELFGRVNRGLEELSRWFRCNRLTLKSKKTRGRGVSPPRGIMIGGEEVRWDSSWECLAGLTLFCVGMLSSLYNGLVLPHLQHCLMV